MQAHRAGRPAEADRAIAIVLTALPDHPAAWNMRGMFALDAGDARRAADAFARSTTGDPAAPALWMNLAKAQRLLGDDEGERRSLLAALSCDQRHFMALVRLAELHERHGEKAQAAERWRGVIALAPTLDHASPQVEAIAAHATAFVAAQQQDFAVALEGGLATARDAVPSRARRRFDACVDHALGRRRIYANACAGVHFPFLPADEFFDREHFPWLAALEAGTEAIAAEAAALMEAGSAPFRPYVAMAAGTPDNPWSDLDHSDDWSALHLWKQGVRDDAACALTPRTTAIVEALPLADMPGRAPTVFFSILKPHARIPPHTGVSNIRAIVHLPLIVPPGCRFRVGGETREWEVGRAFAFDDTIEHEACNESDSPRAILILDAWNPHIDATERDLLRTFLSAADASGHDPNGWAE